MAYSKRADLLIDLVSAVERLRGGDVHGADMARSVRSGRAPRVCRVSDRLNETDVQRLISCYREGVIVRELAEQFKLSMSSVKRLLRKHKTRRKDATQTTAKPA
jgi:DNA invertase Pin-like site-specific DNA recombinase